MAWSLRGGGLGGANSAETGGLDVAAWRISTGVFDGIVAEARGDWLDGSAPLGLARLRFGGGSVMTDEGAGAVRALTGRRSGATDAGVAGIAMGEFGLTAVCALGSVGFA